MNSFSLYADMIRYFRRPRFEGERERVTPYSAAALLGLICLVVFTLLPLMMLQGFFFEITGAGAPEASDAFEAMSESPRFIFLATILAPILEELLFRSWLGFRRGVFLVMPGLLLVFVLGKYMVQAVPSGFSILCVVILFAAAAVYGWKWVRLKPSKFAQDKMLALVFPYVFWGTALCFGAMHQSNFSENYPLWAMPIVLLPLIFAGGVLGYVRMRFGLWIGMGFHGGYNALILLISTLAMMGAG